MRVECGCWVTLPTSLYRIDARTRGVIIGHAVRAGVWCPRGTAEDGHRGAQMIQEVGPNVRLG